MIVNWGHLIETAAPLAVVGTALCGGWYAAFGKRREERRITALSNAATVAKAEMRETMQEIVTSAIAEVKDDMIHRVDESDKATAAKFALTGAKIDKVDERGQRTELNLAQQFGGNGGGIRQAINELGTGIADIKGRFEQHVTESKNEGSK